MRSRSPFALIGVLVILLLSVVGFAAFSAEPAATSTTPDGVVLPVQASGRIAAAAIAADITSAATDQRLAAEARREAKADRATTTTTEATTTTTEAPDTGATQEAAPTTTQATTTTTAAPATTTTTAAPPPPTTTTTQPPPPPPPPPGDVEAWRTLVEKYWPAGLVDDALAVMDCESGGDPNAYNPSSGAAGLFQFLPGTWTSASVSAGWKGADVFDGEANIAVAAWLSGSSSSPWQHWNCKP